MKAVSVTALGLTGFGRRGAEVSVLCPFHADTVPSASFNVIKGLFYCYACGKGMSAKKLAEEVGGQVIMTSIEDIGVGRDIPKDFGWVNYLTDAIDNEYLKSRGIDNKTVKALGIRQNKESVVFPCHNQAGTLIGAQARYYGERAAKQRYDTFGTVIWGWPAYRLMKLDINKPLFLVEGVFGAIRAYQAGVQAIALLGTGRVPNHPLLNILTTQFETYLFLDDDEAGYKALSKAVRNCRWVRAIVPGGEADELSIDDWRHILETKEITRDYRLIEDYVV